MTTKITSVVLDVDDQHSAEKFYDALGVTEQVRVRPGGEPTSGFRGYTLSLVVGQPATVDAYVSDAADAGAEVVKQPSKSLWGYGGSFRAPDGTVWTVASSSKKNTGPVTREHDLVLLLGVDDVKASKVFYAQHGLGVGKSYGSKYVELDTRGIKLALQKRKGVAKNAGVDPEGTGSHRITIVSDVGTFTDPDGYVWDSTG